MMLIYQSKAVVLFLLDLSAAFDTIDHDDRLEKLFGLSGSALDWFNSNLKECRVYCQLSLLSGVPKDSVLGPELFTM